MRVRQPVQQRVRHEHGGAEHGPLQRRLGVRFLLRAALRQRRQLVPPGVHHGDGHQLLPAQLRPPQRRRRLVQPAAAALRHGRAGLPPHRAVPRRHRARRLQEGSLREEGRHPFHHQRALLLQPGAGDERGRRRRRAVGVHQGHAHGVAGHVPELGPELAEQHLPGRPVPLLQGRLQRRPHPHQQRRRARRVAVRTDIRGRTVLALLLRKHWRWKRINYSALVVMDGRKRKKGRPGCRLRYTSSEEERGSRSRALLRLLISTRLDVSFFSRLLQVSSLLKT